MMDDSGKISYFMATIKDITERKKMTEAVRLEAERLKSLVEIVQYESESIQELLEFTLDEAIKLTKSKVGYIYFYDEHKNEFTLNSWSKDIMKECTIVEPQTVYQLENTGIWGEAVRQSKPIIVNDFQSPNPLKKGYPEGHAALFKFMSIPVFYQNRIVAVLGVANKENDYDECDVQQLILLMDSAWKAVLRKRGEEELKNQIQQKMEYTRALVHELKTPLTSLQIASDILSEIATASPYLDVSNNISRGVKQLSRRADALLDIARGEIGLLNLRYRKVNLDAFCNAIKEELIPIANKKGIYWNAIKISILFR
jgi:transcriptional regulator with GAF, ATPase, and Fis domain